VIKAQPPLGFFVSAQLNATVPTFQDEEESCGFW